MSEARDIMGDVVDDRAPGTTDTVTNLTTGATFAAEIQDIEDTILNTELGIDARATTIFNIRDDTVPIVAMQLWSAIGHKFMVLPRNAPDNPASVMLKVYCQVLIPGKDDQA